jgi:hypothetical protein
MNGNVSRRIFVGSLAGAGVGAVGATALLDFSVSAQPVSTDPLTREIRRQLKEALGKMRDGQSAGATQAATVLRVYASTLNDGQLQALLRKANRATVLSAEPSHGEILRIAGDLGINPATIPPHRLIDRGVKELELQRMIDKGLGPLFHEVANQFDATAVKLETLKRRGQSRLLSIALRQPIPTEDQCGHCNQEAQIVENCEKAMAVACAAAAILPILAPACEGAAILYLAALSNYGVCMLYLQLCRAYYGN